MKAQLWVPGPLPGQNEVISSAKGYGGKGRGYSLLKRRWTDAVALLAKAGGLPHFHKAVIDFVWLETKRNRDPDNIVSAKKFVLDGLVVAKVLPGDGWAHVEGFRDSWGVSTGAGVLVTLEGE